MKILSTTLLFVLGLVGSLHAAERDEIAAAFDGYKSALQARDGARAAARLSKDSIAQYQHYVDWARTFGRSRLEALSLINRFQVFTLRHRIPHEELRTMDGRAAFIHGVTHDWLGQDAALRISLDKIEVQGERATAEVAVADEQNTTRYHFVKEEGQWRVDLAGTLQAVSETFKQAIKQHGMTEQRFLVSLLERASGKKVTDAVWDPVR